MVKGKPQSNQLDHENIIKATLDYAHGVAEGSWERVARAYDVPKAQMKLITGEVGAEKVYIMPVQELWDKVWSKLPESPAHRVEILSMQILEGRMAVVSLNNNGTYIDLLSLYKVNDSWKIYDKLSRTVSGAHIPEADLVALFGEQ